VLAAWGEPALHFPGPVPRWPAGSSALAGSACFTHMQDVSMDTWSPLVAASISPLFYAAPVQTRRSFSIEHCRIAYFASND
jgi:hypothetical protein